MMRRLLAVGTLGLSLIACEKKDAPPPAAEATPIAPTATQAVPAAAAPAEPVVDVATLPVEEQYEAEAEKDITAENLSAKLDELEKELAAP